ncbi:hypothetical protein ACIBI4_15985 [Streptomyces sp. NPDC050418]|uniref:DUF7847 domain-containing protein n=1 Tax=Streptomyces sp. NPDC050418 TaxID=3365612 RepID=UPI00379D1A8C
MPPPPKPGVIPLAPLGLGEIYGGAFSTMGRYARQLFGSMAAGYALLLAAMAGIFTAVYFAVRDDVEALIDTPERIAWDTLRPVLLAVAGAWFAVMLLSVVINAFLSAVSPVVLEHAVVGRTARFGEVWRRAWSRTPSVLGVTFLTYLLIAIPIVLYFLFFIGLMVSLLTSDSFAVSASLLFLLALLTVPLVLWLTVSFTFAPAVAVLESAGPLTALKRSYRLVRGTWWRTFGITLLTGIIAAAVMFFVRMPLMFLGPQPAFGIDATSDRYRDVDELYSDLFKDLLPELWTYLIVSAVIGLVLQLLYIAFTQLVASLLYIDQRIRREGLADGLARAAGH